MARACFTFPSSFLFGTATAGYQVEGNSTNTDFWQWEHKSGTIAAGERSETACDWWDGGRWRENGRDRAGRSHPSHCAQAGLIGRKASDALMARTGA